MPNQTAPDPVTIQPTALASASTGIEAHDESSERLSDSILGNHLKQYDEQVAAAHDFVKGTLGMKDVSAAERVAVLPAAIAKEWGVGPAGGHYVTELDVAYVFEPDKNRPKTAKLAVTSGVVHELAHSASVTPQSVKQEHSFYHESLAGLAEYFVLQKLSGAGEFTKPPSCVIKRQIDGEEVSVLIPGDFRRVDAAEVVDGQADTTQALIGAMIVGMGLKKTNKRGTEILSMTTKGGVAAYDAMKAAVEAIEPGFAGFIAAQPNTTDGIIKIAQRAQWAISLDQLAAIS